MNREVFLAGLPREVVNQEFRPGLQLAARISVVLAESLAQDQHYHGDPGVLYVFAEIVDHLGSWREG